MGILISPLIFKASARDGAATKRLNFWSKSTRQNKRINDAFEGQTEEEKSGLRIPQVEDDFEVLSTVNSGQNSPLRPKRGRKVDRFFDRMRTRFAGRRGAPAAKGIAPGQSVVSTTSPVGWKKPIGGVIPTILSKGD